MKMIPFRLRYLEDPVQRKAKRMLKDAEKKDNRCTKGNEEMWSSERSLDILREFLGEE